MLTYAHPSQSVLSASAVFEARIEHTHLIIYSRNVLLSPCATNIKAPIGNSLDVLLTECPRDSIPLLSKTLSEQEIEARIE